MAMRIGAVMGGFVWVESLISRISRIKHDEGMPISPARDSTLLRAAFLVATGFLTLFLWTVMFIIIDRQVRSQDIGTWSRDVVMVLWPVLPFAVPAFVAWRFRIVPVWLMTGVTAITAISYTALFLFGS